MPFRHYSSSFTANLRAGPQGSILGPAPSVSFIHECLASDFSRSAFCLVCWYGANTANGDKEQEKLQYKMIILMQQFELRFCKNGLTVNTDVTCVMSLHCHHNRHHCGPCFVLNKYEIEYGLELRFLGLLITENLVWHVQSISYVQV